MDADKLIYGDDKGFLNTFNFTDEWGGVVQITIEDNLFNSLTINGVSALIFSEPDFFASSIQTCIVHIESMVTNE